MSEVRHREYNISDTDQKDIQIVSVDPVVTVKEEPPKPKEIKVHTKNLDIFNREFVFPMLKQDKIKCKKQYDHENNGFEKLFKRFKQTSDPSIPYKKVVTSIIRIRTLNNPDQELGEYVYYFANLYGFQKHFNPETTEITEFQSARLLNLPFLIDKKLNMQPDYQNNQYKGMKELSEYPFYTQKFIPSVNGKKGTIDEILEGSDQMENVNVRYSFKDMGKDYGGYTREEISTLRADRLVSRNTKKEMGSVINPEDQMELKEDFFPTEEIVPKKGKK
jgi:hypothetical protein